jgi:CheY-like chemotaxis protein
LQGKRILVVDDNATNRRILALQAAKWGMAVRDTGAPEQALEVLMRDSFDLAILDMHMPDMDGATLAARIRKAGHSLPLVLFSSLGSKEASNGLEAWEGEQHHGSGCYALSTIHRRCRQPRAEAKGNASQQRNVVANYPFERSHRFAGPVRISATETIRL